jgi:hypothetical protein
MTHAQKLTEALEQLQELRMLGADEILKDAPDWRRMVDEIPPIQAWLGEFTKKAALLEFAADPPSQLYAFFSGLCGATQTVLLDWVNAGRPRGHYPPFKEAGPGICGEIHEQIQEFRGLAGTATPRGLAHFKALVKAAS